MPEQKTILQHDRRRITAFHESAHCIVLLARSLQFDTVTIKPDLSFLGQVQGIQPSALHSLAYPGSEERKSAQLIISDCMACISGVIAEEMFLKKSKPVLPETEEIKHVVQKLYGIFKDEEQAAQHFVSMYNQTKQILKDRWFGVTMIAEELLKRETLTRAEVINLIYKHPVLMDAVKEPTKLKP
jgi:ATP-dependent Zn protease